MERTEFISRLSKPSGRFLAEALEHGLAVGRRTPHDFIRQFSPETIMASLDQQPRLRATFLTVLVGLREKTALRTPSADAGRLLEAALEEGDTDQESITRTFEPDDRVRYLDPRQIWSFVTEGEFWKVSRAKDQAAHKLAQTHIAYLLDRALAHGLASHADIIDGITIEVLGEKLPRGELTKIVKRAIDVGRRGASFRHSDLLEATPSAVLVDHIALPLIFDAVIMPVARLAGYVDANATSESIKREPAPQPALQLAPQPALQRPPPFSPARPATFEATNGATSDTPPPDADPSWNPPP